MSTSRVERDFADDASGDGDHAREVKVVRQIADQLAQPVLIGRAEGRSRLDGGEEAAPTAVWTVHGLGAQSFDTEPRRLRDKAAPVSGSQVATGEIRTHVARDA